jgi:anti-sigma factor RsiW
VADKTQFEEQDSRKPAACAVCEAMLSDAVDGALSAAEQQAFDRHVAGCVECSAELAAAKRGAAWLAMLKGNAPEPPAALLERILAGTTGTSPLMRDEAAHGWATQNIAAPARGGWGARLAAARMKLAEVFSIDRASAIFQPRLAMTAAMAFFSIALTLNLLGVRLSDVRAANFTPSALRRTVADTGASVSRTFQNNPMVYRVESRVSDLRSDDAPVGNPNGPSR